MCSDPWTFSCGRWLEENPIPETASSWGISEIIVHQSESNLSFGLRILPLRCVVVFFLRYFLYGFTALLLPHYSEISLRVVGESF